MAEDRKNFKQYAALMAAFQHMDDAVNFAVKASQEIFYMGQSTEGIDEIILAAHRLSVKYFDEAQAIKRSWEGQA